MEQVQDNVFRSGVSCVQPPGSAVEMVPLIHSHISLPKIHMPPQVFIIAECQ